MANQKFTQSISISDEILNSIKNSTFISRIQIYSSVIDFTNATYEEMMLRDSNTTEEYEAFEESPSPLYLSKNRNCGDNVNCFDGEIEQGSINLTSSPARSKSKFK